MAKSSNQADDGRTGICVGARAATQRERTSSPRLPDAHMGMKHLPMQRTGRPCADPGLYTLPREFPTAGRLLAVGTWGDAIDSLDPAWLLSGNLGGGMDCLPLAELGLLMTATI